MQQQHEILYQSNCFCTCPGAIIGLALFHIVSGRLIYYLILGSLSQTGCIILILKLNTLIEGRDLFRLQEYKYCLAVMIHKKLVLAPQGAKQYIFVKRCSMLTP